MASDLDEELLAAAGCIGKGKRKSEPLKRRIKNDSRDSEESIREEEEDDEEELEEVEEEEEQEEDDDSEAPIGKSKAQLALTSRRQQGGFLADRIDDDEQEDSLSELSFGESLCGDEEDRARLEAMKEVDREMLYLERGEKLQEHKQREMKKAQIREEKKGLARAAVTPPPTRKANSASTPSSERSRALRSRNTEMVEILNNLVALKQSKSRDSALKKRRFETPPSDEDEEDNTSASHSPNHIPDQEDEDVESDTSSPKDGTVVKAQQEREREELTFQDITEITIQRSRLAKWLSEPYFEEIIVGCFVRLAVGEDSLTGYHLCQVTGIEAGDRTRMYKLENRTTHKYMSVAFGNKVFTTTMSRVSEQPPMQEEFAEWREVVVDDLSIYKDHVADKAAAISKVGAFVYSADAVKRMIEEKKKSAGRPFNLAAEKEKVTRELALVEHERPFDTAKVGQLQGQLRQLEALGEQRRATDLKAIALAEMNRRNREENFRNASQRKVLAAGQEGYDPFSRRWTRSQNYYSKVTIPQPKVEPVVVSSPRVAADQAAQEKAAEAGKLVNTAPPSNQLVQLHRFELPLDLSRLQKFGSGPAAAALAYLGKRQRIESIYGPPVEVHDPYTHPQTLSINDYKRRMNLID